MLKIRKILHIVLALLFISVPLFMMAEPAFADTPATGETTMSAEQIADNSSCKYSELQQKYMEGSTCWYCFVVGKMTSAYLYAASLVIPTVKTLALMIVKFGFFIWLALLILKQVSSLSPITSGKFLQEILVMGFKVLLAILIIHSAIPFINAYIMTPVIDTSIDIGNAIFDEIAKDFTIEDGGK